MLTLSLTLIATLKLTLSLTLTRKWYVDIDQRTTFRTLTVLTDVCASPDPNPNPFHNTNPNPNPNPKTKYPTPTLTLTLTEELDAYAALTEEVSRDHHALRTESQDDLHGNVFYSFGLLIAEAAVHLVVVTGLCYGLDMPHYALPGSIKFPGSELESFLAIWNPLCLSSIMAFARQTTLTLTLSSIPESFTLEKRLS